MDREEKRQVHIPSASLAQALIDFSLHYKRIIIGRPSILQGHNSHAVKGEYTAEQALTILLKDTGLSVEPNNSNGFIVKTRETFPSTAPALQKEKHKNAEEMLVLAPPTHLRSSLSAASDTTLDKDFIEENRIETLQLLSTKTPNLTVNTNTLGYLNVNIRGVLNYGNTYQSSQAIPIHYNGHFISATQSIGLILHDLEEIDVYRGPQNTHSGRSSVGGSVYIDSTQAKLNETEFSVDLSAGNYNLRNLEGAINLPLGEQLAFRIAGMRETRDGYINTWNSYDRIEYRDGRPYNYSENPAPSYDTDYEVENFDNSDKSALRISGIWEITDSTQLLAHWEKQNNRSLASAAIDPYLVKHYERALVVDSPVYQENNKTLSGLTLNHEFSDIKLNYSLRHSKGQYNNVLDLDFGPFGEEPQKDEFHRRAPREEQLSHNIEFEGTHKRLQWLAGFYHERFELDNQLVIADYSYGDNGSLFSLGIATIEPEIESIYKDAYGHAKYQLTQKWSVNAGARYIKNKRDIGEKTTVICWATNIFGPHPDNLNTQRPEANLSHTGPAEFMDYLLDTPDIFEGLPCFSSTDGANTSEAEGLTYHIGSTFDINDQLSTQLTYSTGYRPGELKATDSPPNHKSRNLELGISGTILNDNLHFDTAIFYSNHDNIVFDRAPRGIDATVYGLELSISDDDFFGGVLMLSGAYLNTNIDELDLTWEGGILNGNTWNPPSQDPVLAEQGYYDFSGNHLPNSPEYSLALSYEYPIQSSFGTWIPRIQITSVGEYYLDIVNANDHRATDENGQEHVFNDMSRQPAYSSFDLALAWHSPSDKFSSVLSIYNATDENIRISAKDSFFSNEGYTSTFADPRLIILKVSYKYN